MKKILILLHKIPIKSEGYNEIFLRTVAKIYCFYNNNFSSFKTLTKEYGLPL